jgi:hypothetical protein
MMKTEDQPLELYRVTNITARAPRIDPNTQLDLRTAGEAKGHAISFRGARGGAILLAPGESQVTNEITGSLRKLEQRLLVSIVNLDINAEAPPAPAAPVVAALPVEVAPPVVAVVPEKVAPPVVAAAPEKVSPPVVAKPPVKAPVASPKTGSGPAPVVKKAPAAPAVAVSAAPVPEATTPAAPAVAVSAAPVPEATTPAAPEVAVDSSKDEII